MMITPSLRVDWRAIMMLSQYQAAPGLYPHIYIHLHHYPILNTQQASFPRIRLPRNIATGRWHDLISCVKEDRL